MANKVYTISPIDPGMRLFVQGHGYIPFGKSTVIGEPLAKQIAAEIAGDPGHHGKFGVPCGEECDHPDKGVVGVAGRRDLKLTVEDEKPIAVAAVEQVVTRAVEKNAGKNEEKK